MPKISAERRLPIGAEILSNGVHFRVWCPQYVHVAIALEGYPSDLYDQPKIFPLENEGNGYFSGFIEQASLNSLYRFKLADDPNLYPDPASRYQPEDPHGPSQVIDPSDFTWTDQEWKGVELEGRVLYEMHIGTFTQQGTWSAAKRELLELADLGINIIEMMPIAEFPGRFGWGYDGVNLFAPFHHYGTPDDLRNFINYAHNLGIAVILDVVYNHFGPDGNYLSNFCAHYFAKHHTTEWGEAINFYGDEYSKAVREFFIANAGYWIDEFHFDGLRIDATQNIYDDTSPHILAEISDQVRKMAPTRKTYLIAENECQLAKHVLPIEEGGWGLDALWNDDFHHTAIVRLTGRNEAYYTDYLGSPQEFILAIKYGYLYQGQWYLWQARRRGTPALNMNPACFIHFIENHDQIANSAHGLRIHRLTDPGNYRTMTALLILGPQTPMLFQGQEFAASTPFYYFVDHANELSTLVFKGRKEFFKQFPSIATPEIEACIPDPADPETFNKCKLNYTERHTHAHEYSLHRDLLRLRHNDPIFSKPRAGAVDGAVLNSDAFVLRFFGEYQDARLLIINFGVDLTLSPAPNPLLAPPEGYEWEMLWSSEHPRYGGGGTVPLTLNAQWRATGHCAVVLISRKMGEV